MARAKVRSVNFNAVEFLEGTTDLDGPQIGTYIVVLSLIYARGEPIANDAKWINRRLRFHHTSTCRRHLDTLMSMGKLTLTEDGKLSNPRAEKELDRARHRMSGLTKGRVRTRSDLGLNSDQSQLDLDPVFRNPNDLGAVYEATTTTTTNIESPTTTESVSAAGPRSGGKGSRSGPSMNGWHPSSALLDELHRKRPDLTDSDIASRTDEWRTYAAENGLPRRPDRAWLQWMINSAKREQPGFVI